MHIITNAGYDAISRHANNKMLLNCMCALTKKSKANSLQRCVYDSNAISKRLEESAKIKQQLDADILERNNRIIQSAEARKKIDK